MKEVWLHTNEVQLNTLVQGYHATMYPIGQGVAADQRIGNVVNLSALQIRGVISNNSVQETVIRFLIVGYNASNGDPTVNLFRNTSNGITAGVSAVNGLDAMYFPLNKVDMHVYTDKMIKVAGSSTGNAGENVKFINYFHKLNGRKVEYKGGNGYGSQNWMYSVIVIAADANDDTSTGTTCELSYFHRLWYKDA